MAQKAARCFCVDGTNIVRGCYGYAGSDFRVQEDADSQRLIAALDQLCLQLGGQLEVEVVFDGEYRPWRPSAPNLRVRFSRETEADDLILDAVRGRAYEGAGRVTVVTGDCDLGEKAREDGARWQRVAPGTPLEAVLGVIESRFA